VLLRFWVHVIWGWVSTDVQSCLTHTTNGPPLPLQVAERRGCETGKTAYQSWQTAFPLPSHITFQP